MLRMVAGLTLSVSLAGCGVVHSPLPPELQTRFDRVMAPTPEASPAAVGAIPAGTITRQIAGPQTYLAPMPTAVVLLRRDQESRNTRFCSDYIRQDGRAEGGATNMLLVRWPLAASVSENSSTDCDRMMSGYDFTRSASLIQAFTKEDGGTLGTVGPHVLVIYPDGGAILIDGSSVAPDELGRWSMAWARARQPPAGPSVVGDWEGARRAAYGALSATAGSGGILMGALR